MSDSTKYDISSSEVVANLLKTVCGLLENNEPDSDTMAIFMMTSICDFMTVNNIPDGLQTIMDELESLFRYENDFEEFSRPIFEYQYEIEKTKNRSFFYVPFETLKH